MSYDMGNPHSGFDKSVRSINHWVDFGFAKDKIFIGIPFYGRDAKGSYTYKQLFEKHRPDPTADKIGSISFNGINTIRRKTAYVKSNGLGGIMIWEISQDTNDDSSLLKAIDDVLSLKFDLDSNGFVDFHDLVIFAIGWVWSDLKCCDLNEDGVVSFDDLAIMLHDCF